MPSRNGEGLGRKQPIEAEVRRFVQAVVLQHSPQRDDLLALAQDDAARQPPDRWIGAFAPCIVRHEQRPAVVLEHPFEEPGDPGVPAGQLTHHPHRRHLGLAHPGQARQRIGITARRQAHRVTRGGGVPGPPPLAHGLDLLGLVPPDLLGQGPHTRFAAIKHQLSHPQGSAVVLHHRVDPAQVVGLARRPHLVAVPAAGWGWAAVVMVRVVGDVLGSGRGELPHSGEGHRCQAQDHGHQGWDRTHQGGRRRGSS